MKFPTNTLAIFNMHGGSQTPDDSIISVPQTLQGIAEIPEPCNRLSTTGDSIATQNSSFVISNLTENTNFGGGSIVVCVIGPGLWSMEVAAHFTSNYVNIAAGFAARVILVRAPIAASGNLFSYYAQNNQIVLNRRFIIALAPPANNTYTIQINVPTNGVGETLNVHCSVIGNRLG